MPLYGAELLPPMYRPLRGSLQKYNPFSRIRSHLFERNGHKKARFR